MLGVVISDPQTNNVDDVCRREAQEDVAFKQSFGGKVGLFRQKREGIQRSHAEGTLWEKLRNRETA